MNPTSTVIVLVAVVAALYFGRDILIPLALSVLLTFALAPIVIRLRRLGLPRIPAVLACVLVVTLIISGIGVLVGSQLLSLADNLGSYQANLSRKIQSLKEAFPSGGTFERASEMISDLNREIDEATKPAPATVARSGASGDVNVDKPVPVELHERPPTAVETLQSFVGPVVGPLVTAGMILVFVVFMLIERTELRDRLVRMIDARDLSRASKAVDDAAQRVSRYLLMQLLIAVAHGLPYGLGLWAIGVPNPLLWGFLATALRFVPFLGPVLAAVGPLAIALAVDPGWTMVWETALLILVLELFTNNVLEPWLYGSTTGLSPIAILAAAVFWTSLWGPVGLLLSVPLTVCVVVLGRHVPGLGILDLLLGDQPALSDAERIYQRLLAGDRFEALDLAERFEGEHGFERLADEVFLPVLRLAERDRERQSLEPAGQERVASLIEDIGADLADVDPHGFSPPDSEATEPPRPRALCVGGRHALDLASAGVLGRALELAGIDAKVVPAAALRPVRAGTPDAARPQVVLVAYLSPPTPQHLRRLERRAGMLLGAELPVLTCLWTRSFIPAPGNGGETETFSSVAAAVEAMRVRLLAKPAVPQAEIAAATPA